MPRTSDGTSSRGCPSPGTVSQVPPRAMRTPRSRALPFPMAENRRNALGQRLGGARRPHGALHDPGPIGAPTLALSIFQKVGQGLIGRVADDSERKRWHLLLGLLSVGRRGRSPVFGLDGGGNEDRFRRQRRIQRAGHAHVAEGRHRPPVQKGRNPTPRPLSSRAGVHEHHAPAAQRATQRFPT